MALESSLKNVTVGCRVMVYKAMPDDPPSTPSSRLINSMHPAMHFHLAEVMSVRRGVHASEYYVHYVDFNKRLDEWVSADRLDMDTMQSKEQWSSVAGKKTSQKRTKTPAVGRTRLPKSHQAAQQQLDVSIEGSPSSMLSEDAREAEELEHLRRGGSMTRRTEEISRVKNIDWVELGRWKMQCWYFSPYPIDLIAPSGPTTIVLCEFCLSWQSPIYCGPDGQENNYTREELCRMSLKRHYQKCPLRCPPGTEIARISHSRLSFFEIDGHKHKDWTRKLCLLSKLFLDHKTLFYDVDPFLYYVLCENDERGSHLIGYFSKEKDSADAYNVACILTLPCYQRRGFGRLLIEFSYELSKREGKIGSPEKPLSDLGLLSYRSYWAEVIIGILLGEDQEQNSTQPLSIDAIARMTSVNQNDILHTLQWLGVLRYRRHGGQYCCVLTEKVIADWRRSQEKIKIRFEPKSALKWTPPVFTPAQLRFL